MADPEESQQEKTEAPSPKRRRDAREKGQVAKSREVVSAGMLVASGIVLVLLGGHCAARMGVVAENYLRTAHEVTLSQVTAYPMLIGVIGDLTVVVLPMMAAMAVCGLALNLAQVGFVWSFEPIAPRLERLNPVSGFRRIFSRYGVVECLKSILKMVVVGYLAFGVVRAELPSLLSLDRLDPGELLGYLSHVALQILIRVGVFLVVLAVFDYAFQRWEYERRLRMTHQELKEELKEREGNPQTRARIRSMQRELARRRMMAEVPRADVVITNPVLYAVALRYVQGDMGAPTVVAKGRGYLAQKIREVAIEHRVPIVEQKPLARALYEAVEIGQMIPVELYKAVAEVLAYVYRLRNLT